MSHRQQDRGTRLQHSPVGGTTGVSIQPRGREIELSVSDSGPGITEEAQRRIFERFDWLDLSRSPQRGGTGLELAIAQAIAPRHGGVIRVESTPGHGAMFSLRLSAALCGKGLGLIACSLPAQQVAGCSRYSLITLDGVRRLSLSGSSQQRRQLGPELLMGAEPSRQMEYPISNGGERLHLRQRLGGRLIRHHHREG